MQLETLGKNQEFKNLYRRGRSYVGKYVVLYVCRRQDERKRVGFTVGRKIGAAVARNRIRRRLKEIYRLLYPQLQEGYDVVIVARMRARDVPYRVLADEVEALVHKAGLLVKEEAGAPWRRG